MTAQDSVIVDVFYARTPSTDDRALDALAERLTPAERDFETNFRLPEIRCQYRLTRVMTRSVLAQAASCDPQELQFKIGQHGKPHVCRPQFNSSERHVASCAFNITHTHGVVLCAVSSSGDVGVDVERIDRQPNLELADRYFAPLEVQQLLSLDPSQRTERFLQLWTLKEAFIKALGTGLSTPLNNFAFHFSAPSEPSVQVYEPSLGPRSRWVFRQFQINDEFLAAVGLLDSGATAIDVRLKEWKLS
jgi:4'-phosphopantetheinyl transferase